MSQILIFSAGEPKDTGDLQAGHTLSNEEGVKEGKESGVKELVIDISEDESNESVSSTSKASEEGKEKKDPKKKKKAKGKKRRGKSIEAVDLLESDHASKKKKLLFEGLIEHNHIVACHDSSCSHLVVALHSSRGKFPMMTRQNMIDEEVRTIVVRL
ncbi:uncharacterized protein MELLADRAFT_109454 [Melampsora larici-populina 98AG31]|uniref:Uncharacterized protein n=1 Tax=Melampsora larici-populina (strain 98AG31 / pathotype 3-4-7) TaxID=747676 RepID=F4RWI6_MELLP|nr:uncharacterized protein MELLADRAFT_109454 [Melampsora larici-populina 98AG31]EGG03290.1 hypothetical protein MELLADRAFT_109454 [Melampsora larici-populina 98AG31]